MKALLLAAGLGTRLRPITDTIPKCLVPIKNKPLLGYWLDMLFPDHIDSALINTHYLPMPVRNYVASSRWADRVTLVQEPVLLGTGGTILKNREYLQDEPFLLVHADNLTRFDVGDFIQAHKKRPDGVEITMMTFNTDVPESCGIVETDDDGIVTGFYEKSTTFHGTVANAAVYIMEPSVIDFLVALNKEVIDISTEVLPHYLGKMHTYHNSNYHRDIGTPESLRIAELEF